MREIINNPRYLVKLAAGSELRSTRLSNRLRGMFPEKVYSSRLYHQIDNPENQFCKYALQTWADLIIRLNECTGDDQIQERTTWALREIERLLRHEFFSHLSGLREIPFSSQVLQNGVPTKSFFSIYNRSAQLLEAETLPEWQSIIELKNIAELYEYWTFIQLCKAAEKKPWANP